MNKSSIFNLINNSKKRNNNNKKNESKEESKIFNENNLKSSVSSFLETINS